MDVRGERPLEETKRLARVLKVASLLTSRPRSWTRAGLATLFEVSERSIDRGLELLRGLGYEITRTATGYALACTPALPPVTLALPEVLALTLAAGLARDSGDIDTASLGAALAQLEALMPPAARPLVRQELLQREATARSTDRRRRKLPAEVTVLLCVAMSLFPHDALDVVLHKLVHGLRLFWPDPDSPLATKGALCQAR